MADLLFVYGSLRRAADFPEARLLAEAGVYRGPARAQGRLYRIDWYPGFVPSADPLQWVVGDLFALEDGPLLAMLDGYEGCGPDDPEPHEFRRARIIVEAPGGTIQAWAYLYAGPIDASRWIPGGDFLGQEPPSGHAR